MLLTTRLKWRQLLQIRPGQTTPHVRRSFRLRTCCWKEQLRLSSAEHQTGLGFPVARLRYLETVHRREWAPNLRRWKQMLKPFSLKQRERGSWEAMGGFHIGQSRSDEGATIAWKKHSS